MQPITVLSLGAGVQSSTLALMAARGDLPKPDVAIFADTGGESARVYAWLDWLEGQLPFPIVRVRRPGADLGETWLQVVRGDRDRSGASLPGFYVEPGGMTPFHCSKEFKTRVVGREIRRMLGLEAGQRGPKGVAVEQWLGISLEEIERMKDNELAYVKNRWPLVELRMRRADCLRWMAERQYPEPPRSACTFCPFRSDDEWRTLRDESPEDFASAVAFDAAIRPGWPGMTGEAFLHRSKKPIGEIDFDRKLDLFDWGMRQECEGACGT